MTEKTVEPPPDGRRVEPLVGRFYGVFSPDFNDFGNVRTNVILRTYGTSPAQAWRTFLESLGGTRAEWNKKGFRAKPFVLLCDQKLFDDALSGVLMLK